MGMRETHYLSGLADGEGCFFIEVSSRKPNGHRVKISFNINLRDDSACVLELLQSELGGHLFRCANANREGVNPQVGWRVTGKRDVLSLIHYFDNHPLFLKSEEYVLWREAAMFYYRHTVPIGSKGGNPGWVIQGMKAYASKLKRLKKYDPTKAESIDVGIEDFQRTIDFQ